MADQKVVKNLHPSKSSNESKTNSFQMFLLTIVGRLLNPCWRPFFIKFRDPPKTFNLNQVYSETLVLASQSLPFLDQFSINFSRVFGSRSETSLFFIFCQHYAKQKFDLGALFGPQLLLKWQPKSHFPQNFKKNHVVLSGKIYEQEI